ncbi:MAG TPA: methyl-accepting chemotaxis protein [Dongiaceae bacterium]|nr:methyl-accepting chemotaxis protein [Dongiaceae bacterium]
MTRMLTRLRIGTKILSIVGIALLGFAAVLAALLITDGLRQQVNTSRDAALSEYIVVQNIAQDFLNARRREKDFLLRKDKSFADMHAQVSSKITDEIKTLLAAAEAAEADKLQKLSDLYQTYDARFIDIASDVTAMGLTPDSGLLGKLRGAVHEIEAALKSYSDPQLMISMLMMRRHEKDFIAREDKSYIDLLSAEQAHFGELVKNATFAPDVQQKLSALSATYLASFQEMAKLDLAIKDKLAGMSEAYAAAEPILASVQQSSNARYDAAKVEMQHIESVARITMIATVAVIALLMLSLAWVIGRGISRPVIQLADAMKRLSSGDKSVSVPVVGRDEVAEMAGAFGVFKENMIRAEHLAAQELEAQRQRGERALLIEKLTNSFDQDVSAVLRMVASATTEMQATASSMTATAEETSRQSTVVASASEEASMNVQTVATATEELSASVSEIGRQVTQSAQIAGRAVSDAESTNAQVRRLAEAAQKIGEVVSLINEIASQTNLLALNATIEAARAGEMGKGFAVVASEVKNLANQTARATEEIGTQIAGIQQATGEAVQAIQSIGQTIGQINEITTTISAAVEEQGAATQEIARNVQQAAIGTQEVSTNIAGVSQAATTTGAAADQVLTAAGELSRQSETLRGKVETFLAAIKAA